ncbi:MAG: hypothetical protein Q9215_007324 [Flavoplaca cf. flavocitrina]
MAVEVMRMPVTDSLVSSDVARPQSSDDLRVFPKDLIADFEPRHTSERIGLKASVRGVLNAPFPTAVEGQPPSRTAESDPVDRRASTVSISEDVHMLTCRLQQTRIETIAPNSSIGIQVPKGYGLGLAYGSSTFYKHRAEARTRDKRKRDLGVLPKHTGRQKHGFQPEELLWYGAVDLKGCKSSDLDNEIHPLFHRDHFDDTPDYIYDQLIPGLRLASLFLSHPSCMQFWVTLAKGERRVDQVMSERYHKTQHRIPRKVPMTKENVQDVAKYIEDLGNAKAIHFRFVDALIFQNDAAFATTYQVCDFSSNPDGRQAGNVQRCHVRLHSDFYIIAKKLSTMVYPDPAQKLRFNFNLASLIVHEMSHAIELSQWRNRAPSPFEPFLLHHNKAELGRAWETCMFGGQISPINDRVDGIYGIGTWDWPPPTGEMNPERTICYALPMNYIEDIQQKLTWQQPYELDSCQTRFNVPRDGATSIYMNSVTTVSWTEEERVAKEALQEQQAQDSEEPAKKKRETADGKAMPIKEIGVEPENLEKKPSEKSAERTVAQQVNRVKREPMGVLSRKQRRMQKKKMEQKTPPPKTRVIEHEDLLDPEDPEDPVQPDNIADANANEDAVVSNEQQETADDDKKATKDPAVPDDGNGNREVDTPAGINEAPEPEVGVEAKPNVSDAKVTEDTQDKSV